MNGPTWGSFRLVQIPGETYYSSSSSPSLDAETFQSPEEPPVVTPASSINDIETLPNLPREHFFPLHEYLPLGCLLGSQSSRTERNANWDEIHDISKYSDRLHEKHQHLEPVLGRLIEAQWIRVLMGGPPSAIVFRIHILPDDLGHLLIERANKSLRTDLVLLIAELDVSKRVWRGRPKGETVLFDPWATPVSKSLFWLFNTLPSPLPLPDRIPGRCSRMLADELLQEDPMIPGLKTKLFPYQARTVAAMIEREAAPQQNLDPRFEKRTCPDGRAFYYSSREMIFRRKPVSYECSRGGILAETMGVGKTLMCLTLVLATKYHLPRIPPQHFQGAKIRENVGSLSQMAAATAGKHSISARSHFSWFYPDLQLSTCISAVESEWPSYDIPYVPRRSNRTKTVLPPPRHLQLCSATIIVVPRNLIHQWEAEVRRHVEGGEDGLRILTMQDSSQVLPSAHELLKYDIVLFSKTRFEKEHDDGSDSQGRTSSSLGVDCRCPYIGDTRTRDCSCLKPEDIYSSPLKQLHFLRIIIDEGHEFSSSSSKAVTVATKLVTAERRWVVSGTPARERLFGVDVELAAHTTTEDLNGKSVAEMRDSVLEQQFRFNKVEEKQGAARPIGILLTNFLQARPWANAEGVTKIDWEDHIFRHEHSRLRTHDAFSLCMQSTLENLVIKTRPEDIEKDIILPKLEHKVVYLQPSFYDTVTINNFILFLTANAVTSERTDVDYLFHKNSSKALHTLIRNLRASNFFWTGFTKDDLQGAITHSRGYLAKEDTQCTDADRKLLQECLDFANIPFSSSSWNALSLTHELGLFVGHWPDDSAHHWALNGAENPHMIGATHLRTAQRLVNSQLLTEEPLSGLGELGVVELGAATTVSENGQSARTEQMKMGVPSSGTRNGEHHTSPRKGRPSRASIGRKSSTITTTTTSIASIRSNPQADEAELDSTSPLVIPTIMGTTSSKMSYLLDRIVAFQTDEKILIFYDNDNTAWYIAQCLELMHIKHLIYAKSLRPEQRSKWIVTFDTDDSVRVLLMDIETGALGLNVNKASRVFFINPPCKPHQEAQAIKRAHRIGQEKPVFVETLILRGTIEEAMFNRSKAMTREEHLQADKELLNDRGVAQIIQAARILPVKAEDGVGTQQMAPLNTPLQIFGRKGRGDTKIHGIDAQNDRIGDPSQSKRKRKSTSGKSARPKKVRVEEAAEAVAGPSGTRDAPISSIRLTTIAAEASSVFN